MTIDKTLFASRIQRELPVLSPHAAQILRACEDPAIDLTTLVARLGESPTLAARLLGLANSAFYGQDKPVSTLPKAIQILGLVTVRGIALGLVIGDHFSPARCPAFDPAHFWESAVLTARLAQMLAPLVPPDRELPREAAFMAGLLHNIGLLALVGLYPAEMNEILADQANDPAQSLGPRLCNRFGSDHRQVAGWLAGAWQLPAPMRQVMEHCHETDYRGASWPLTLLIGLCARSARGIIAADGSRETAVESEAAALMALGLDEHLVWAELDKLRASLDALHVTANAFIGHAK